MSRITLQDVRLSLGGKPILENITWSLQPGQHWGILGANGSGKSTFMKLLRGDLQPDQRDGGTRLYHFGGEPHPDTAGIRQRFGLVSSEIQERYTHHSWNPPALEVVLSGFFDSYLLYQPASEAQLLRARTLLQLLGAEKLEQRKFLTLSQGQARRILLARALAPLEETPAVLMLDEASEGLDSKARSLFFNSIKQILHPESAEIVGEVQLLFATHRLDELELLSSILTHRLLLKHGHILAQEPVSESIQQDLLQQIYEPTLPMRHVSTLPATADCTTGDTADTPTTCPEPLLEIRDAEFRIQGKTLLDVDHWQMLPGQQWVLLGANGAGKSTFLRMLYGSIPAYFSFDKPAYITRFGQRDDDPDAIPLLTLHERMGFVSPELQASLGYDVNVLELTCSGKHAALGAHLAVSREALDLAMEWLDYFGVADLADQDATTLSSGQLRRVLLARALMGTHDTDGPYILLLDEPFSGLDPYTRKQFYDALRLLPQRGISLVCALHRSDELIPEFTHGLLMQGGRIATQGLLADVLKEYKL